MASRERWRQRTFDAALQGVQPEKEPDWGLGDVASKAVGGVDSAPFTEEDEVRYAAMKAEIEGRLKAADARHPVFPGSM